jgi:hypothetical protein
VPLPTTRTADDSTSAGFVLSARVPIGPALAAPALAGPVLVALVGAAAFVGLAVMSVTGGFLAAAAACRAGGSADGETWATGDLAPGAEQAAGGGVIVAATVYSGSGPGAYGAGLAGHLAFAELGLWSEADTDRAHADRIGVALGLGGALAPFTRLQLRAPDGRVVVAEKRDVGMGGPPVDGHPRAIDLWTSTRRALGLPPDWSGLLRVAPAPGGQPAVEAPSPEPEVAEAAEAQSGGSSFGGQATGSCTAGSLGGSPTGLRISELAAGQLGVGERPRGSGCTVYGPCEEWCALFATWVWRKAGVPVPLLAFSGDIYTWAQRRGLAYPPDTTPQPGWVALFGSGPADPATSQHAAIVDAVLPDGRVTFVNGNFAGTVARTGPCLPAHAQYAGAGGCQEPGPIYGYAAPA